MLIHSGSCAAFPRLLTAAIVLLVAGTACRKQDGDRPVARVNGVPVPAQELVSALPAQADTGAAAAERQLERKRAALEELVDRELLVQEAQRLGLEANIEYALELEQKGLVIQELYRAVVASAKKLTDLELDNARRLLENEVRLTMIEVESESLARSLAEAVRAGALIETLAMRHSVHSSRRSGGDLGYLPELWLEEPVRNAVLALDPGQSAGPIAVDGKYRVVSLSDRRAADPPPPPLGEMRQELEFRLGRMERQKLADQYLADLRARLEYNPEGIAILCRPVESITPAEQEVPVAVKDGEKYVKVSRMLAAAAEFPPALDSAMRAYAIRRKIEEDLMYEDGLGRGLDKLPDVQRKLAAKRRDLLYQALYQKEVQDKAEAGADEVRAYYEENAGNYPGGFEQSQAVIKRRLDSELRAARLKDYVAGLRAGARIEIDEKVLRSAGPGI